MSKKNVLYISPNGYLGGAERFILNTILVHKYSKSINAYYLFLNKGECYFKCKELTDNIFLLPHKLKLRNLFQLIRTCFYIRKLIKKYSVEIIHGTMPYGYILCYLSCIFLKINKVWFQHGPVGGTLDKLSSLLPVDLIIFNSNFLQQNHNQSAFVLFDEKKQIVLNLGIQVEINKTSRLIDKRYAVLAGRICSWKGQDLIIDAIKLINDKLVHFYIIGDANNKKDKEYLRFLNEKIKKYNLINRITILPFTHNIHNILYNSDLFIHTSKIPEPFGLIIGEAMLCECFVIGSDQGGITDILINNETGFSYNPCDFNSHINLAFLINKYFKMDDINRACILDNAKKNINTKYSLKFMNTQLEAIYNKM